MYIDYRLYRLYMCADCLLVISTGCVHSCRGVDSGTNNPSRPARWCKSMSRPPDRHADDAWLPNVSRVQHNLSSLSSWSLEFMFRRPRQLYFVPDETNQQWGKKRQKGELRKRLLWHKTQERNKVGEWRRPREYLPARVTSSRAICDLMSRTVTSMSRSWVPALQSNTLPRSSARRS